MRTLEYVNERIQSMQCVDSFGTKKEIKELPNILRDDEELLYIASGLVDGNTWLIACTDIRIIFLDKGMIFGSKQKEIPLEKINSVQHSKGLVFGKISIWNGASQISIENVQKSAVDVMVNIINTALNDYKEKPAKQQVGNSQDDLVSKLERLAALKDKGVITEEEFIRGKEKILGSN